MKFNDTIFRFLKRYYEAKNHYDKSMSITFLYRNHISPLNPKVMKAYENYQKIQNSEQEMEF